MISTASAAAAASAAGRDRNHLRILRSLRTMQRLLTPSSRNSYIFNILVINRSNIGTLLYEMAGLRYSKLTFDGSVWFMYEWVI